MRADSVPLVISPTLLSIGLLVSQALHIFRKRNLAPFFVDRPQQGKGHLKTSQIWCYGLLYLVPAFGIIAFMLFALNKAGSQRVLDWFEPNAGILFLLVFLGIAGTLCIAMPSQMVRWSLESRGLFPPYSSWLIHMTRFIGAVFLVIVFSFLARM